MVLKSQEINNQEKDKNSVHTQLPIAPPIPNLAKDIKTYESMAPDSDKHPQNSPHVTSTPQVINISSESAQFSGDIIHENKLITSDKPTTTISNEPASIKPLKEDKPTLIPLDTTEPPSNTAIYRPANSRLKTSAK